MSHIIKPLTPNGELDRNFVKVNMVPRGTKITYPNGRTTHSTTGHVWMTVEIARREPLDVGWSTGDSLKEGGYNNITHDDGIIYDRNVIKSYEIQMRYENAERLVEFINKAPLGEIKGFSKNYNLFTNNCIDFVQRALNYSNSNSGNKLLPYYTPNGNYDNFGEMLEKNYETADKWGEEWAEENNEVLPSPLIIDLNGDGVGTISEGEVYFDITNDGKKESTGWVDKNDGFLVLDKNEDGKIESGAELFGDHSVINGKTNFKNGFNALSELDTNNDSIISKDDKEWHKLKIWKDENSNAIVDENELVGLSDMGIKEINLTYENKFHIDESGNRHKETATVTWDNGNVTDIVDVWFKINSKSTKENINASTQQEIHKIINSMAEFSIENTGSSINHIAPRQDNPVAVLSTPLIS
ncbi:hypothetical protein [Xenorhabdus thuongxuanensis]|uniref:Iron-regulated protein FrpA n=1 Tax=Xenorhabdus thuongxuanensis TaxID=1873484 RepID=A0A1Q5U0I1_9GAMM|nr:hypothetical protein [Xenorhabdus thuongxuanensis]OKP05974.1 iron-regulated protein FrpA [Xenorhabdus thuongxuanensis]